jgi:capsid protein
MTLGGEFVARMARPVYKNFVNLAIASGQVKVPQNLIPATINDAIYLGPQMPWIDPESEAAAWVILETAGYASGPEIIRRRGMSPHDLLAQEKRWRGMAEKAGITFTPMVPAAPAAGASPAAALATHLRKGGSL